MKDVKKKKGYTSYYYYYSYFVVIYRLHLFLVFTFFHPQFFFIFEQKHSNLIIELNWIIQSNVDRMNTMCYNVYNNVWMIIKKEEEKICHCLMTTATSVRDHQGTITIMMMMAIHYYPSASVDDYNNN